MNEAFAIDAVVGGERVWKSSDRESKIDKLPAIMNEDDALPILTDIGCAHPSVRQSSKASIENWGLVYDPLQDCYVQVLADKQRWRRRSTLSDYFTAADKSAFCLSTTEDVLDMSINLLFTQLVWTQLYHSTDMSFDSAAFNDQFEFFEPLKNNNGTDSHDTMIPSNLCPWLAVGFGTVKRPPEPGNQTSQ